MIKRSAKGSNASLVLRSLMEADRPLTAYDILDRLAPFGLGSPVTVYRALERLVADGKAHRLETLGAYIVVTPDDRSTTPPAGFAICDGCGGVELLVDPDLRARLVAGAAARRFTPRRLTVEVHGLCGDCRVGEAESEL